MRLKNNIFAAAFDYLKRNKGIKTQKRLAELMGVSEDTITRILKDRTEVTEDIITKLQTASGCIFNLQWLRGEDTIHMLAKDLNDGMVAQFVEPEKTTIDQSSLVNALLAAKDQLIEELKEKYDKMETEKDARIAELQQLAEERLHRIAELRREIEANKLGLSDFPFAPGVADKPKNTPKRI